MDHDDDRKTENEYENDEHFKVGIQNVKVNQISNVYRFTLPHFQNGNFKSTDREVSLVRYECSRACRRMYVFDQLKGKF